MSLLEKAKKKAKEASDQKKKEAETAASNKKYLEDSLKKMTKAILNGMEEFDGVKTKQGTIKLVRKQKKPFEKTVAVLRLSRSKGLNDIDILYIDSAIESGTRDYSDDCRDIPYTESIVKVYVKATAKYDDHDWGPRYLNPAVRGLGLSDSFYTSINDWDDGEKIKESLEKIAEWISPLFS